MVLNAELLKSHKRVAPAAPRATRQSAAARKVAAELARQQASQAAADKATREARARMRAAKATFGDVGDGRGGRSLGAGHVRRTGLTLSFPPGARPKHLQMCRNMEEDEECHM